MRNERTKKTQAHIWIGTITQSHRKTGSKHWINGRLPFISVMRTREKERDRNGSERMNRMIAFFFWFVASHIANRRTFIINFENGKTFNQPKERQTSQEWQNRLLLISYSCRVVWNAHSRDRLAVRARARMRRFVQPLYACVNYSRDSLWNVFARVNEYILIKCCCRCGCLLGSFSFSFISSFAVSKSLMSLLLVIQIALRSLRFTFRRLEISFCCYRTTTKKSTAKRKKKCLKSASMRKTHRHIQLIQLYYGSHECFRLDTLVA